MEWFYVHRCHSLLCRHVVALMYQVRCMRSKINLQHVLPILKPVWILSNGRAIGRWAADFHAPTEKKNKLFLQFFAQHNFLHFCDSFFSGTLFSLSLAPTVFATTVTVLNKNVVLDTIQEKNWRLFFRSKVPDQFHSHCLAEHPGKQILLRSKSTLWQSLCSNENCN
jgi:hypothetical protein